MTKKQVMGIEFAIIHVATIDGSKAYISRAVEGLAKSSYGQEGSVT